MYSDLNTETATQRLNAYLVANNYFDQSESINNLNNRISDEWSEEFKQAILRDFKNKFHNLIVEFQSSNFNLAEENTQGSPTTFFFSFFLRDLSLSEFLKIDIRILVSYNKTVAYLDSDYANIETYSGKSKLLKRIFKQLKIADKKSGYFLPITLKELLN